MDDAMRNEIKALRENAKIAYVASVDGQGFPQVKAMLVLEHESLARQYFSTNLSSRRARQFLENPKAAVYYCEEGNFKGALFTGAMRVRDDREARELLWRDGFEMYYPKGVTDDDYVVLEFTPETVNYYHGLHNETAPMAELC